MQTRTALFLATICLLGLDGCKPPGQISRTGGSNLGGSSAEDGSPVAPLAGGTPDPPSSVTPGTRLVYLTTTATFEGEGSDWKEDPNGNYRNPKDGKHYTRIPHQGAVNGGSAAYTVYDVVAMDGGNAAIASSTYAILDQGAPHPLSSGGAVGSSSFGAGLWANPEVLQAIPDSAGEDRIVHMPYDLNNKKVDALWIDSTAGGSKELHVYEMTTGLLVHAGSSGLGTPPKFRAEDERTNMAPSSSMASSTLTSIRKVSVPWANDAAPDWALNLNSLQFSGQETMSMPGAPQSLGASVTTKMTVKNRGNGWILMQLDSHRDPGPYGHVTDGQSLTVMGSSSLAPLWIAPGTLASLRAGQTIDHDDVLKVDTTIAGQENLAKGLAVGVRHTSAVNDNIWFYDMKTGMLVEIREKNPTNFTTTILSLQAST